MRYIAMGFLVVLGATFVAPLIMAAGKKFSESAEDTWEENDNDRKDD